MKNYWIATAVLLAGSVFAQDQQGFTVTQENGKFNVQVKGAARLGAAVAGSPYSAVAVTENVQTLADGNRIVDKHSEKLYRDGQGRERSEQSFGSGNGFSAVISDPVAKTGYMLDSRSRTARSNPLGAFFIKSEAGRGAATAFGDKLFFVNGGEALTGVLPATGLRTGGRGPAPAKADANVVSEDLPAQTIEGVYATGKRVTRTIPAGQIGNDKPIVTVEEVWYSPDLQMNVMTKHSDPRTGENTYKLTNISRAEPDPSLFQVPSDYTMIGAKK